MRTPEEITAEITALKALKPTKPFEEKTAGEIAVAIRELEKPFDFYSEEYDALTDSERDMINQTIAWRDHSQDEQQPSKGFGSLVE